MAILGTKGAFGFALRVSIPLGLGGLKNFRNEHKASGHILDCSSIFSLAAGAALLQPRTCAIEARPAAR
jgi:hypothetical protein